MGNKKKGLSSIRPIAFFPPFIILLFVAIYSLSAGLKNEESFVSTLSSLFDSALNYFGWIYALVAVAVLLLVIFLTFSKYGKIRLGGENAKPQFSYWNWFAMTLCAGIAIGIVFWGVAEPIYQLAYPPESFGIEPFSREAAIFSLAQIFLEWTFTPYALYTICGIACGYAFYNMKRERTISATLYPLLGERFCKSKWSQLIDAAIIFSLVGGVVASLGEGILQLGSGLDYQFHIPPTRMVWAIISIIIVALYAVSSATGVQKGIRILSDINAKIFLGLMVFTFIVGPGLFIINLGLESSASYVENIFSRHLFLGVVTNDPFPKWWTLFFFAIWYAWAPITGMFLSRMSYGRTIREFITVNMIAPAMFGIVWFSIFGGTAIDMQLKGIDLATTIDTLGVESAMFEFLGNLPFAAIIIPIFLVTVILSFVTAADSMTSTVALISSKSESIDEENEEAPLLIKLVWAIVMGVIAWVMIAFAKIDGVKMAANIAAVPAVFLVAAQAICVYKMLKNHFVIKNEQPEIEDKE